MAHRSITTIVAVATFQFIAFGAAAQGYPEKTIRLIVPFGAGGSSDVVARVMAQRLSEQMGKTVVVENRTGAGGLIGTEAVARSAADGYTLLVADAGHSSIPLTYSKAGFHPTRDFAPVSMVATTPYMLCVHPSLPARSVKELIALARAQPNELTHASGGSGALTHLVAELFKLRTGIQMVHVPYKGGGQSVADTIAGQVASVFAAAPSAATIVKAKRLRALGVTSEKRSPVVPEVPTFEESGIRDFRVTNWYGVLAPAHTPQAIVSRLYEEIVKGVQTPAVRERFENLLLEPGTSTPDGLRALIDGETARWSKVIKDVGIRVE